MQMTLETTGLRILERPRRQPLHDSELPDFVLDLQVTSRQEDMVDDIIEQWDNDPGEHANSYQVSKS